MDGLLLDSEDVYTEEINRLLRPHGKEQGWDIKAKMMGRPDHISSTVLLAHLWPPRAGIEEDFNQAECPWTLEEFLKLRNQAVVEAFPKVRPLPGVMRLVKHLHAHGVPICVATGSKRIRFDVKAGANPELFELFGSRIVVGDDLRIERGKPQPDIFLVAAREGTEDEVSDWRSLIRPPGVEHDGQPLRGGEKHCLVFEDGRPGVTAARRAGMQVVWVPDPHILDLYRNEMPGDPDKDLDAPHQILTSLLDFNPEEWGLPAFPPEA